MTREEHCSLWSTWDGKVQGVHEGSDVVLSLRVFTLPIGLFLNMCVCENLCQNWVLKLAPNRNLDVLVTGYT